MMKRKKSPKEYNVYKITIDDIVIYIGRTNNLKRRQSQHNNLCFKKLQDKQLYNFIRSTNTKEIKLENIKSFKSITETKRYEMLLILIYHFSESPSLQQKVPNITDL